jgi:hypothetical protein
VANWLDTEGRAEGLLTFRGAWLSAPPPKAETRVVKLSHLDTAIPSDTPRVDPAARAIDIAARQEHLRWRFRT